MNTEPKPIKFPEDESAHDCVVEWWYFNGHLKDKTGNEYSYMDCLFKVDVEKVKIPFLDRIPLKTSYFSHSLVSDIGNKNFYNRIAPFSFVSDDSFSKPLLNVSYINPEIKNSYTNCTIEKTGESSYRVKNEEVDLNLISIKPPLLEGGSGFLDLNSKKTYYYSLANLKTEGKIRIKDQWIEVTGKSWMDHQWADTSYSKDKWTWFSIQLDDQIDLVCCVYDDKKVKTYFADISFADGSQEHYSEVEIIPLERQWISPKSKAVYPLSWEIKIPAKNTKLILEAKVENQEMLFGSINYWEGPLKVAGSLNGKEVSGDGFMELVGYPSKYSNVKYVKDGVSKIIDGLFSKTKNKTLGLMKRVKK